MLASGLPFGSLKLGGCSGARIMRYPPPKDRPDHPCPCRHVAVVGLSLSLHHPILSSEDHEQRAKPSPVAKLKETSPCVPLFKDDVNCYLKNHTAVPVAG